MNKKIIVAVAIALVIGVVVGYVLTHQNSAIVSAAPTGATFLGQPAASIIMNIGTAAGTSTSILNTDSNDRVITRNQATCSGVGTSLTAYTGAGLASLTLKAATTSTAAPAVVSNTNLSLSYTVATSSAEMEFSSSSPEMLISPQNSRWASGSYLTWFTNATNTAVCTVSVQYLPN